MTRESPAFQEHGLTAIVLAAGSSKRFGSANKLHVRLDSGLSIIEQVIRLVTGFPFQHKLIVAAANDHNILELAKRHSLTPVINENSNRGIGTSVSCGMKSLLDSDRPFSGVAVFLGDQPFIDLETIELVATKFIDEGYSKITRPNYETRAGHPVFFPPKFANELLGLTGDRGASAIFHKHMKAIRHVRVNDPGVLLDIDRPQDLTTKPG